MWYGFNLGIHNVYYQYKDTTTYSGIKCDVLLKFDDQNKGTMGESGYPLTEIPK